MDFSLLLFFLLCIMMVFFGFAFTRFLFNTKSEDFSTQDQPSDHVSITMPDFDRVEELEKHSYHYVITIDESSPIVLSFCDATEKSHSAESTFEFNFEVSYRSSYLGVEVQYPLLDVVSVLQGEEFTSREQKIVSEDVLSVLQVEELTSREEKIVSEDFVTVLEVEQPTSREENNVNEDVVTVLQVEEFTSREKNIAAEDGVSVLQVHRKSLCNMYYPRDPDIYQD